jgi:hypothetical protein
MPEDMRMMPDPASPTGYSLKPVYRPPTPLEIARGTLNNYADILGSYLTQQAAPRPSQFGRILQGMGYGQTPETVQAQQQRIQNLPLPMENRVRNAITQGVDYAGNFLAQGRAPEIGGAVRSMVEPVAQFPVTAVTDPLRAANQAQQALDPAYAMARGLTTTRLGAQEGNLGDLAAGVTEMGLAGLSFVPGGAAVKGARAMPPAPIRRPPPIGQPNVLAPPASRGPILNQLAPEPKVETPKPLQKAQAEGYAGADIGEAQEWVRARAKGLDMSQAARMERAKAMGFDTGTVLYHGTTANIGEFDLKTAGRNQTGLERGIFLTNNPNDAASYARLAGEENQAVYAVYANMKNPLIEDFSRLDKPVKYSGNLVRELINRAKTGGYDGLIIRGMTERLQDETGRLTKSLADQYVIFNPSSIRSTNAAFDPASKKSANILAGVGAVGAGAAMTGAIRPPDQKKPPGQRPRG